MTCLHVPFSLEDAEAVVVACSGVADWRPLFVLGVQSAGLFMAAAFVVGWVVWKVAR